MVAEQIAKGACEDDTNSVDLEQFAAVAAEMKKSLAAVGAEEELAKAQPVRPAEPVIEKDSDGDDSLVLYKSFENLVASVNAATSTLNTLVKSANGGDSALAKGVLALGHLTEMNFKAVANLEKSLSEIKASQEAMNARLGLPVAPRGITPGVKVQPHPGEVTKNGEPVKMMKSGGDVISALIKERNQLAAQQNPQNDYRMQQIATAVTEIEAGVSVADVIARYNVTV